MKINNLKANSKQGFYFLAGINRAVSPSHVTKLANSIEKLGIIRPVVIAILDFVDGVSKPYIIDGQHLYNACLRKSCDIPYIVVDVKDEADLIEKIALLNASSKSWQLLDYVTSWSFIHEDYKKLNKYFEVYDFELSVLASILSDKTLNATSNNNTTASKIIKSGKFRIYDEIGAKRKLNYLTDILKVLPRMNRFENKYACSEYLNFLNKVGSKYNHEKFIQKLIKIKDSFVFATQEPGMLESTFKTLI